ncbi:MAG: GNAT family N-acetyltransferase [Phaeodactylibacter sp.]|nr:GNAT family N-acetyltransferase [Phaeodactylibacter sp.]
MMELPDTNIVSIRLAEAPDLPALRDIARLTFAEAFSARNTASDMDKYLDESLSLEKLAAELAHPESLFFFAEFNGRVIGYLKVNWGKAQTESLPEFALEIERIYVLAEYHGKSVGKKLFEKAFQLAQQKKMEAIWLGVWEENTKAIRFYRKHGFVEFGKHLFRLGEDEQTDVLMKLKLKQPC